MALPMKIVFAAVATGLLVLGIHDCITNFEENGCEMTWMFEYPTYLNVPVDKSIAKQFPNYKLYVYGEGEYARQISDLKFKGIPVLFIPGNSGSYRQVRSLGSVSLRMGNKLKVGFHFNYFVVDFQDQFSALHGAILPEQTEFVRSCVKKILSMYQSTHPPSSVILVGHSMGGVVARALFTLPGFDPKTVHTIITQNSPHQAPVVMVDSVMDQFYQKVNDYWYHHGNSSLGHVTVVSTGGGYRDYQVRSGLSSLTDILPEDRGISTTTMSVPLAWVSTDHLCSVWCRQMILTTVSALFDIVDKKTKQPTTDVGLRSRVFQHHFLHHSGMEPPPPEGKSIKLDSKVSWEVREGRMWRLHEEKVPAAKYIAFPIASMDGEMGTDSITVLSNITAKNWICACRVPAGQDRCSDCLSLESQAKLLPPRYSDRKFVRLDREELGENTHVVLFIPKGSSKVEIVVDKYRMDTRHLVYEMPSFYDTVISFPISVTDGMAMLQIRNNTVFYSLHLAGLYSPLTAYTAQVSPLRCSHKVDPGFYEGSVMMLSVPWSNENTYNFFKFGETGRLPVKLQNPREEQKEDYYGYEHSEAHLEMYLHPGCQYQLKLILSVGQTMGQFVRFYGTQLPVMFVAVLLLAIGGQLAAFAKDGECLWMPDAVYTYSKPFYMVPVAMVLHAITGMKAVSRHLSSAGVPANDITELASQHLWLQLLPVMLCMSAWLVTILHSYMAHFALAALSRFFALLFCWVPERVLSLGGYLQLGVAALACVSSVTLCGTFGISVSYALLLIKVLRLYQVSLKTGGKVESSQYRFTFLLTLLYMWLVVINAPAMVVWAKGLGLSLHLPMDPSRWAGIVATLCAVSFLTLDSPLQERPFAVQLRWTIYMIAVVSIPYSLIRLYRLNITICITLVLLVSTRLLSPLFRDTSKEHKKEE
ncbi:GPI inositol-deacylase-like [Littorina saxatilis]|uniref:GPI inositol-deacylase-like n=1 Tax=Littorina saxatilis TaxID=31220 RepID=UPI0038B5B111